MIAWVRHGQSTWNAIDRLQGQELGPPLTDLGRQQSQDAARELTGAGIRQVLASPAVRAQQTAQIIADHLALPVATDDLLLEKGLDEDTGSVLARIDRILSRDLPAHTLVVSHGDVIGLAVALLLGQPPTLPGNASITWTGAR